MIKIYFTNGGETCIIGITCACSSAVVKSFTICQVRSKSLTKLDLYSNQLNRHKLNNNNLCL